MDHEQAILKLKKWVEEQNLLPSALENLELWLGSGRYASFHDEIIDLVEAGNVTELNDCFWKIIPFGTGGRRGTMGVGPNRINERTIGESAQGLADYICQEGDEAKAGGCVVAFDTRIGSDTFSRITAEVLAASGIKVYLFESFRSTPELSFAVRYYNAAAGVMITASHNPPTDNGFKAYWSDGGQIVSPHDKAIIQRVQQVESIGRMPLEDAREKGLLVNIGQDVDNAYLEKVCALTLSPERDLDFVYTPLHGTGTSCISPALERLGFTGMKLYEPQATPDGQFPNVPDYKPNPEDPAAMVPAVEYAAEIGADVVLASDPDADRLAVACTDAKGNWVYLNGNQVGALLVDYTLGRLKEREELPPDGYIVRTLVSSMMVDPIAAKYETEVISNLLVGFKYVAEVIENNPEKHFLFGFEESIGYLRADFVRDKDATQAAMYLAELAAHLKADGKTLVGRLDELYQEHGYFREMQKSFYLEGAEGSRQMDAIMKGFRENPPEEIGGYQVQQIIDRSEGLVWKPGDSTRSHVAGTRGNVLVFILSEDEETRVSIRPSGTEPKLKHYVATSGRMDDGFSSLSALKTMVDQKAGDILEDIIEIEKSLADS